MPGDPRECREHAARCAVPNWPTTHTPQLKATFLELSRDWERLAIQLEEAFAQIDEINPTMLEAGWLSADPDTAPHTPSFGGDVAPGSNRCNS